MARPRGFDEEKVRDALRDVFWERGYEGASLSDIMAATGLNKGSLYASFGDKRALYAHAISRYGEAQVTPGISMLRDKNLSPETRIKTLFDGIIQAAETPRGRWGCLLCNAAVDQAPFDRATEASVKSELSKMKSATGAAIKNAPAASHLEMIWTAYFGGRVMVKAGYSKAILRKQRDQVLALFNAKPL